MANYLLKICLIILFMFGQLAQARELDPFEQLRAEQLKEKQRKMSPQPLEVPSASTDQIKNEDIQQEQEAKRPAVSRPPVKKLDIGEKISEKSKFEKLSFGGRTQFDYRQFQQSISDAEETIPTSRLFAIRRARFEFRGSLAPSIHFKSSLDITDSVKPKDVYLDWKTSSSLTIRLGQFKFPFGNETISSSRYYEFLEMASISNTLATGRDRGVMIYGKASDERLNYAASVISATGTTTPEQNSGWDSVIQSEYLVLNDKAQALQFWLGGAITRGSIQSSKKDKLEIMPETESGFVLFSVALPNEEAYNRQRYAIDFKLVYGSFFLGGEYLNGDYTYTRKATINGGYLMASYILTRESRNVEEGTLDRQHVSNPITNAEGWGAWELAFRYSRFNVSDNFFESASLYQDYSAVSEEENARRGTAWSIAINWYPTNSTRVMLNWIRSNAERLDSDRGEYNSLKSEQALLVRTQIEF